MFVAANLTPNFAVTIAGHSFPGYSALYAVILNLIVATILTPVLDGMGGARRDETVEADYRSSATSSPVA